MKTTMTLMLTLAITITSSVAFAGNPRIKFNEYANSGPDEGIVAVNLYEFPEHGLTWTRISDPHARDGATGFVTIANADYFVDLGTRAVLIYDDNPGAQGNSCLSDLIAMRVNPVINGSQKIQFLFLSAGEEFFNQAYTTILKEFPYTSLTEINGTLDVTEALHSGPLRVNFEQHDVDAPVPEPSTLFLLGGGLGGLAFLRRRARKP